MMLLKKIIVSVFALAGLCFALSAHASTVDMRLYALNCGSIEIHDGADFSDTEFYPHKSIHLADPCFLIKHADSWMLWDLGLGDQYLDHPVEDTTHGVTLTVTTSLVTQLKTLGITPSDIHYISISHVHFDHTGNARLFPHATWLMQRMEYHSLQQKPVASAADHTLLAILQSAHKILLNGDYDVFGDRSVVILRTPGHTVGHQSLQVTLPHTGVIILSGDVYHTREAYRFQQIPNFNTNRAETLASMSRVAGILQNKQGRLIIQHDPDDFAALPVFPHFLS